MKMFYKGQFSQVYPKGLSVSKSTINADDVLLLFDKDS